MIGGGDPFYRKFWVKATALERNRLFLAVKHSEKGSINNNKKVTIGLRASNEPKMIIVHCL